LVVDGQGKFTLPEGAGIYTIGVEGKASNNIKTQKAETIVTDNKPNAPTLADVSFECIAQTCSMTNPNGITGAKYNWYVDNELVKTSTGLESFDVSVLADKDLNISVSVKEGSFESDKTVVPSIKTYSDPIERTVQDFGDSTYKLEVANLNKNLDYTWSYTKDNSTHVVIGTGSPLEHTFTDIGNYDITVVATSKTRPSIKTNDINTHNALTVAPKAQVLYLSNLSYIGQVCSIINDNGVDGSTYTWFADGVKLGISQGESEFATTIATAGTKQITTTVTQGGITSVVSINYPLTTYAEPVMNVSCDALDCNFKLNNANADLDYVWRFSKDSATKVTFVPDAQGKFKFTQAGNYSFEVVGVNKQMTNITTNKVSKNIEFLLPTLSSHVKINPQSIACSFSKVPDECFLCVLTIIYLGQYMASMRCMLLVKTRKYHID